MDNPFFQDIKGIFGFGCMRLPMQGTEVDLEETCRMVDAFLERGFNYFDTAHGYLDGKSEVALQKCLTSRYPREAYILTDKLTAPFFKTEADIRPFFQSQLDICGVDYFDFYLMHAQGALNYGHFQSCNAYGVAAELKREGKIRHLGISFHDKAEMLERILTDHPEVEVVQIQFNYLDYEDPAVQSKAVYEVCRKFNKPVIVMEPCKGGSLIMLPDDAAAVLAGGSPASYAIRFAAGFDGMMMVLSGMSDLKQMEENLDFMSEFRRLNDQELTQIRQATEIVRSKHLISCTTCRYCTAGCPKKISIPDLFACLNSKKVFQNWNADYYYTNVYTQQGGKASDCIKCGKCEQACPQHLSIRKLLEDVAAEFEK